MALIYTTKGDVEETLLTKTSGTDTAPGSVIAWTAYHLNGELVRRDAHVSLENSPVTL